MLIVSQLTSSKFQNQRTRMNSRIKKAGNVSTGARRPLDPSNALSSAAIPASLGGTVAVHLDHAPIDEPLEHSFDSDSDDESSAPYDSLEHITLPRLSLLTSPSKFGACSLPRTSQKRPRDQDFEHDTGSKRVQLVKGFAAASVPVTLPFKMGVVSFGEILLKSEKHSNLHSEKAVPSPYMSTPLPSYPSRRRKRELELELDHWPRKRQRSAETAEVKPLGDDAMDVVSAVESLAIRPRKRLPKRRPADGASSATPEPELTHPRRPLPNSVPGSPSSTSSTPALSRSSSMSSLGDMSSLDSEDFEILRDSLGAFVAQADGQKLTLTTVTNTPIIRSP